MTLGQSPRAATRYAVNGDVRCMTPDLGVVEMVAIDISRSGMGVDGLVHFPPDSPLSVEFPDGTVLTARTRWQDSFWSGLAFDEPLSVEDFDCLYDKLRRMPRFSCIVSCAA